MKVLEQILKEIDDLIIHSAWPSMNLIEKEKVEEIIRSHMEDDGWISVEKQGLPKKDGMYWVYFVNSFSGYSVKAFWNSASNSFIWPSNGRKIKDLPTAWQSYYTPEPYQLKED